MNMRRAPTHRGGVLFEVVLSLALFGGAAAFTLGAVRSVFAAIERIRLQQEAVDLARSRMAELQAGLISLADLRSGVTHEGINANWVYDLRSRRTEFTGLTLVELTVRQDVPMQSAQSPMSFTLHQLLHLRPEQADGYELDEVMGGS